MSHDPELLSPLDEAFLNAERDLEETGCDQVTLTTFDMQGNELSSVVVTRLTMVQALERGKEEKAMSDIAARKASAR